MASTECSHRWSLPTCWQAGVGRHYISTVSETVYHRWASQRVWLTMTKKFLVPGFTGSIFTRKWCWCDRFGEGKTHSKEANTYICNQKDSEDCRDTKFESKKEQKHTCLVREDAKALEQSRKVASTSSSGCSSNQRIEGSSWLSKWKSETKSDKQDREIPKQKRCHSGNRSTEVTFSVMQIR